MLMRSGQMRKEMAWRDLREFDLPMRFSAVFQLFVVSV